MVRVKICGITNLKDALVAIDAGCDALGFVFYRKSPRYIAPLKAREIIRKLPARIKKIGVFVNARQNYIKFIARLCHLDMLQFHGNESPQFIHKFKGYKIIKAFRIKNSIDFKNISRYKTFAYLFDTFIKFKRGGTGRQFNWSLLKKLHVTKGPIFLSGGLNKNNVKKAIEIAHPDWVDVSSSIEERPGKKDRRKIKEFIEAAQERRS